jgi:hypothetical protein
LNTTIRNNYIHDADIMGVRAYQFGGSEISGNRFENLNIGIYVGECEQGSNKIYNNLIAHSEEYAIRYVDGVYEIQPAEFYDNTIYGGNVVISRADSDVTFMNNLIYTTSGEYPLTFGSSELSGTPFVSHNLYYNSYNNRRVSYGPESYTTDNYDSWLLEHPGSLFNDPLFVSPIDHHLSSNSPAIDAGIDVGITEDIDGNPISGSPDIGAYEYQDAECTDTCESLGYECGMQEVCGAQEDCGICSSGVCVDGHCTVSAGYLLIDHDSVSEFQEIPSYYLSKARNDFNVSYAHTSHGSQIVRGMNLLTGSHVSSYSLSCSDFSASSTEYDYCNDYSSGTTPQGVLSLWDRNIEGANDLGNPDRTAWYYATINHLNGVGSDRNMIMWSWCGQVYTATESDIADYYLANMNDLETRYPDVKFIYMTGHLNTGGPEGNVYARNNQIRDYVRDNNKILFDFADIESYDPDGNYYPYGGDECGWCSDWCSAHECPDCGSASCVHSHCFNCYQKGKAFWVMLARLSGWDGTPKCPEYTTCQNGQTCQDGICVEQVLSLAPSFSFWERIWNWIKNL